MREVELLKLKFKKDNEIVEIPNIAIEDYSCIGLDDKYDNQMSGYFYLRLDKDKLNKSTLEKLFFVEYLISIEEVYADGQREEYYLPWKNSLSSEVNLLQLVKEDINFKTIFVGDVSFLSKLEKGKVM